MTTAPVVRHYDADGNLLRVETGDWRTRWTNERELLQYITMAPNPFLDVPLPQPRRQFPREQYAMPRLAPWQRQLLSEMMAATDFDPGVWLSDPLADVRAQVQEFLDQHQQPTMANIYGQQLDRTMEAWAAAVAADHNAHPYRYTLLED